MSITTVCFQGINSFSIEVQVQMSPGLSVFTLVGMPDKAVSESRERIRASLTSMGLSLPSKRIVVNLSPADVQKEGSHYDLPIALAILGHLNVIPRDALQAYVVLGELALDGRIMRAPGAISAALHAVALNKNLICPGSCGGEAAWAGESLNILAPFHLLELLNHFKGTQVLSPPQPRLNPIIPSTTLDLQDIRGQETAKHALEISAAGGHHLLMMGPPGVGKSMLASRLIHLLPPLSPKEALEVTMITSMTGRFSEVTLQQERPFRSPHHSASMVSMVGGGMPIKPGEVSLAHHGVLFLDELPEFSREALEALRQPLESGRIAVARARENITFPAQFQLIAAMNPCPCGYYGDPHKACRKSPLCAQNYQRKKLSGPFWDRIHMCLEVSHVTPQDLKAVTSSAESSTTVSQRIQQARRMQQERQERLAPQSTTYLNGRLESYILNNVAHLSLSAKELLMRAMTRWGFSARTYHKILAISRTLADLNGHDELQRIHVDTAISYQKFF